MTVIDARVNPAFYACINGDESRTEMRHEQLGIWKNGLATLDHVRTQMQIAGIDRLMLHAEVLAGGQAIVSNDEIAEIVLQDSDHFGGVGSVDPFADDVESQIEKVLYDQRMQAIYLAPSRGHYFPADPRLSQTYEICSRVGMPIVFSSGLSWEPRTLAKYSRPIEFEEIAVRFPQLRFALTQFGWPWAQEAVMLALKYPQIYLDTGMLYSGSAREWYTRTFQVDLAPEWIDRSLRHQVMFASGAPRFEQIRMVAAIDELPLRESTRDLIRGANAEEFYATGDNR